MIIKIITRPPPSHMLAPLMRLALLTLLVLIAFAGNSVLARLALSSGDIGPWSFSLLRFVSGAVILLLLARPKTGWQAGRWSAALALCGYGVFFSFAYLLLATGTGALLQAFLPSVKEEGEYSFLYFGGRFSHAARKTPKARDYRIQSIYGGAEETYTTTQAERETPRDILNVLEFTPLYARVDLLRGEDGAL